MIEQKKREIEHFLLICPCCLPECEWLWVLQLCSSLLSYRPHFSLSFFSPVHWGRRAILWYVFNFFLQKKPCTWKTIPLNLMSFTITPAPLNHTLRPLVKTSPLSCTTDPLFGIWPFKSLSYRSLSALSD